MSRRHQVGQRGGRAQQFDIVRTEAGALGSVPNGVGRHRRVGDDRLLGLVDRVVPRLDAAVGESDVLEIGGRASRLSDVILDFVVGHGFAGEKAAGRRDVSAHIRLQSSSDLSLGWWCCHPYYARRIRRGFGSIGARIVLHVTQVDAEQLELPAFKNSRSDSQSRGGPPVRCPVRYQVCMTALPLTSISTRSSRSNSGESRG